MALLRGSVEADVPIQFADREWSEFVWRSLYGSYAKGFEDVVASLSETDADSGTVTVEIEYSPRAGGDATAEVAQAQARLERDLEKYRVFLVRRCEQESCRPS